MTRAAARARPPPPTDTPGALSVSWAEGANSAAAPRATRPPPPTAGLPAAAVVTAASVAEGSVLSTAAASFLTSTVSVSVAQRRVTLPRVFLQYPSDFDHPEAALLSWLAKMLTPPPGSTPPPSGLPALPESPEASKQSLLAAQIRKSVV